ncbi:MAG: S-layer homology domain-containing protein [Oscillospiraceae bacterium]|nr:S-layer homology domain-containing protein [Oscillospiraceae bacterium]
MKRTPLRIASLLLTLCLLLALMPVTTVKAATLTLSQLQEKFPNGAYWNHYAASGHSYSGYEHIGSCNNPDGYTWSACYSHNANAPVGYADCNVFNGGMQCCGFARKLAYDAYGSYATNWTNYTYDSASSYMWSSLKPGDVLHYTGGNADATYGHWVFVTGVSGNAITVAECNIYGAPCQIRWGNVIYKGDITPVRVCVAPYALDTTTASSITWTDSLSDPSQTDAYLYIKANAPYSGSWGEAGITVWDAYGNVVAQKTEAAASNATNYLVIWYNLTAETGAVLTPNSYYTYQFHVYFNGTCYTSDIGSFTTDPCATHTIAAFEEIGATCTSAGSTGGTYCSVCNSTITPATTVPALGHNWDSGTVTKQPTATTAGVKTYSCSRCTATETEAIPATGICDGGNSCPSKAFADVAAPGDWSHSGIDFGISNGLFQGTSATTFEPDTAMTRAMLVTVLWRYEGSPQEGSNTFSDVPNGTWYTQAVAWAAKYGIVEGVGSGKFAPNDKITREQLSLILFRYSACIGRDNSARGSFSGYADGSSVSSWAYGSMQWAVAEGLINGIQGAGSTVYLTPQGNATRAQVATILMRYITSM